MTQNLSTKIASVPDREEVVVELWYENQQWGEISQDLDKFELEIYPQANGQPWKFNFDEMLAQINTAKSRLLSMQFEN